MATVLLIGWAVAGAVGLSAAGFYPLPSPLRWHPCAWIAESLILRRKLLTCALILVGIAACWSIGHWCAPPLGAVGSMLFYAATLPLPYYLIQTLRRDHALHNIHYVYWNAISPLSLRQESRILASQSLEELPMLALYIRSEDWGRIPLATQRDRTYLEQFHQGSGLYWAPASNDFLHIFDSLDLYRFLINPDNRPAMHAFRDALMGQQKTSTSSAIEQLRWRSPGHATAADVRVPEAPRRPTMPTPVPKPVAEEQVDAATLEEDLEEVEPPTALPAEMEAEAPPANASSEAPLATLPPPKLAGIKFSPAPPPAPVMPAAEEFHPESTPEPQSPAPPSYYTDYDPQPKVEQPAASDSSPWLLPPDPAYLPKATASLAPPKIPVESELVPIKAPSQEQRPATGLDAPPPSLAPKQEGEAGPSSPKQVKDLLSRILHKKVGRVAAAPSMTTPPEPPPKPPEESSS